MNNRLYESEIEQIALDILRDENGYVVAFGPDISEGVRKEREYTEVVLQGRLRNAIDRLNPAIPADAREEAAKKALRTVSANLLENNEAFHRMLTDGIDVKFSIGDGKAAFNQLQTYKQLIPSLFTCNAVMIVSDGWFAKVGTCPDNQAATALVRR